MNTLFRKNILFFLFLFPSLFFAQSYAPPAGQVGTTAIHKDSSVFMAWATGVEIERGFLQISDTTIELDGSNKVSHGEALDAIGPAEGNSMNVLSLGDGGKATLTFQGTIFDGEGPDFAVFENSFQADFLELAFVDVSSDGEHFFRFPAHSENQFEDQIFSFGLMDCRFVHNLAGKYKQGFGTPFDLSDLPDDPLLNKNAITHVRVIDVVGAIEPEFATYDALGNIVNDPFPTPFASGGFDLDAVGAIHFNMALNIFENQLASSVSIFPNPVKEQGQLYLSQPEKIESWKLLDVHGNELQQVTKIEQQTSISFQHLSAGVYLIYINDIFGNTYVLKWVKE